MKRSLAFLSLLVFALTACQPTTGGPSASGPIKLGFIGPLTGDAASIGTDMLHGVEWAVKQVNDAGGISGRQVELVAEDGKCTGSEAASAAQKLVNVDKVVAIVGGLCSGETLAAAPIAEAGKVVLLSPGSSSPEVTKAGTYVLRNYPSDALKTPAMAAYFAGKGYKKVAIISENTDFAQAFRSSLTSNLPSGAVVFDEVVDPGTKDFRTLLSRMKKTPFDVFFPNPNGDAIMAVLVQQFREAGFTQEMVSHDVGESLAIPQIAGKAAEGFRFINVPTFGKGDFEARYVQAYGQPQSSITWAAFSSDAANVLFQAMKDGATDGTAIRDALLAMPPYTSTVGTFHFDQNGDVVGIPYVLKEFKDGKIVELEPVAMEKPAAAMEKKPAEAMEASSK